jgi:hypothetical protein
VFAGIVRAILVFILGLALGLLAGCDSCECDDDDSGVGGDDDDDDDASPAVDDDNDDSSPDDDDNDDNDDDNDDATPFCADGYLTPAGDCLTQIEGGNPGDNGVSTAVAPDGAYFVAANRGRDLVIYSRHPAPIGTKWMEEVVVHMAANPVIAFDGDGALQLAYLDIFNDEVRWGIKTDDGWSFEIVDAVGAMWDYSNGVYLAMAVDQSNSPHLAYLDYANHTVRYARRTPGGWLCSSPLEGAYSGSNNSLVVGGNGVVHLVTGGGGMFSSVVYYLTNASGDWQVEDLGVGSSLSSLDIDASGVVHIGYSQIVFLASYQRLMHRWGGLGAWRTEMVSPYVFNFVEFSELRLDRSGRPQIYYVSLRGLGAPEEVNLEHATRSDTGDWSLDVFVSDSPDETYYHSLATLPIGSADVAVVASSSTHGLVFYGPPPTYEPAVLGGYASASYLASYFGDGDDERYFYGFNNSIARYVRLGAEQELLVLAVPNGPLNLRMAVGGGGETHLYYEDDPDDRPFERWYVHQQDGLWVTEAAPIQQTHTGFTELVADGDSVPHWFFGQSETLVHLWKEDGDWFQEALESNVDYKLAAASAASTIAVAYYRADLGAVRCGVRDADGVWDFSTAMEGLLERPDSIGVAVDADTGAVAICVISPDGWQVDFLERQDQAWSSSTVFSTPPGDSFEQCAVGIRQGSGMVLTVNEEYQLLQAAQSGGLWTTRTLDPSSVHYQRAQPFLRPDGSARLGYLSECAIQRAIVRAP